MTKNQRAFVETVLKFYSDQGRCDLSWRQTTDPYEILVSEIMLQQTQVARVRVKYEEFLRLFPTVTVLAKAPLGIVLSAWQGLGYNRRAKMLHGCAKAIVGDHKGVWPHDTTTLRHLPGVGPYTASAVAAFAWGVPSVLIETNIRTVYLHHFFKNRTDVADKELLPLIATTLDYNDPRTWYYALMDYGSYLKQTVGNISKQSTHYTKQTKFVGSDRQIRGAIIKTLSQHNVGLTLAQIKKSNPTLDSQSFTQQIDNLMAEKMLAKTKTRYHLPR